MVRISQPGEDLVGKVCSCSLGRVGIVAATATITFSNGDTGVFNTGMGLDGRGLWATGADKPTVVLAETLAEYIDRIKSRPSNVLYATVAVPPVKN